MARGSISAMSLIATKSMSSRRSLAARRTIRPIRPKPLIATRTATAPPRRRAAIIRGLSGPLLGLFVQEGDRFGPGLGGLIERHAEVGQEAGEQAGGARRSAIPPVGQRESDQGASPNPVAGE